MKMPGLAVALLALSTIAMPAGAQPDRPARAQERQAGKIDLRPKLERGEQHRFTMNLSSSSRIDYKAAEAEDIRQSMSQEFTLLFRVTEADPEKGATAEFVFERIKVDMDSPLGKESFDSSRPAEKDGDSLLAPLFRPVVGTTLTVTFDAEGNITSVTGGEGLALAATLGGAGQGGAPSAKELIGGLFTVKKGNGFASVGETWTNVDTIGGSPLGGFKMTTEHTLKSHSRNEAKIAFRGRIDPDSEAAAGPVRIIEASHTGDYLWDTREGVLTSMEADQKVLMEITTPGSEATTTSQMSTRVRRTR